MSPETILRINRIQLLCRLAVKAPAYLSKLIIDCGSDPKVKRGWARAVQTDLKWLTISDKFKSCVTFNMSQWFEYARDNCKVMKRESKKFARMRVANIPGSADAGTQPEAEDPFHVLGPGELQCDLCSSCFPTLQKLSLHRFKAHNAKNHWRLFVYRHTHCSVCMKQFHNRERLINHIRYRSKPCRYNYQLRGYICNEAQACEVDLEESRANAALYSAGKRRHTAQEPVVQLAGPILTIFDPGEHISSAHHHLGKGHNYYR